MEHALETQPLTVDLLKEAKRIEFPDNVIARLTGKTEEEIKKMRYDNGIKAVYKMVDTCARVRSFHSLLLFRIRRRVRSQRRPPDAKKVLVLGSGPIRIGQGYRVRLLFRTCYLGILQGRL